MKIKTKDLERWKENTIKIARELNLEERVLNKLEKTELYIIPKDSGNLFYGWTNLVDNQISVYETNPSRYLPKKIREVWNQSGMDHELIGHLYNEYSGRNSNETNARKTQINIAKYRGERDRLWKFASIVLPSLLSLKDKK